MGFKYSYLPIFLVSIIAFGALQAQAQSDASTRSGRARPEEDLPKGIKETLAKARLKNEEKEFNEMLERASEAAKIGAELNQVFEQNRRLSTADFKKIDSLERLVKRIRRDLGGKSGDAGEDFKVTNLENAFAQIEDASLELSEELKKSSRYSISVKAIENSNVLLILMQFIKSNSRSL